MAAAQSSPTLAGTCLCGAVAFEVARERGEVEACHCGQCRRWSGSGWMNVNVPYDSLKFRKGADKVGWFRSSEKARRGFCKECGSALFWHADRHPDHAHTIAVSAGSLDAPTGLRMTKHIFVADKGDYYKIADGLPQKEKY